MNRIKYCMLLPLILCLALSACGGGGGGGGSSSSGGSVANSTVSGQLQSSYINGASVCVDETIGSISENCTTTAGQGNFTLQNALAKILTVRIANVSIGSISADKVIDGVIITPTLLAAGDTTKAQKIAAIFHQAGTTTDNVTYDLTAIRPTDMSSASITNYLAGASATVTIGQTTIDHTKETGGGTTGGSTGGSTGGGTTGGTTSYFIRGTITSAGSPLSSVTISLTGASTTSATTDAGGNYAFAGAQNGSYTITPSRTGYTFSPTSKSITVSGANLTGQDFIATVAAPPQSSNLIKITGNFGGAKSAFLRFLDKFLPSKAFALNPGQVAKVIAIGPDKSNISAQGWGLSYQWNIGNVNSDGSFSVEVRRDSPVGMIFVGYGNEYLGYLSLKNGITSIPVNLFSTVDIPTVHISGSFENGELVTGSVSNLSAVFCDGTSVLTSVRTVSGREGSYVIGEKLTGEKMSIPITPVSGTFQNGEMVTGSISKLTAVYSGETNTLIKVKTVTGAGEWAIGETITGSISGAIALVQSAAYYDSIVQVSAASSINPTSIAAIDLGTLSSSGSIVEPSRDPLTSEIRMTAAELKSLAQISSMFSSIVKNPDVDGNGVMDFLEGKNYIMQIIYRFNAGAFNNNLVASASGFGLSYNQLSFSPPLSYQPNSATITGPAGSPFASPTLLNKALGDSSTNRYYYYGPSLQTLLTAGTYTVQGSSGGNLIYYIPDQTSVISDTVVIIPTVELNEDRTIKKISWLYRMADGSIPVDPSSFISVIHINLASKVPVYDCGGKQNCDPYSFPTMFANLPAQEIDVSSKKIPWDTLLTFNIGYTDIYFNAYALYYRR
jgi:hypothetical protein